MSIKLKSSSSYECTKDNTQWWLLKGYIEVSLPDSLEDILYVEYQLPASFDNPIRQSKDMDTGFSISEKSWGSFELKALVFFKDASKKPLAFKDRLNFVFRPEDISGKTFYLIAKRSGKNLDIENFSEDDGARVVQWEMLPVPPLGRGDYYDNYKFKLMDAGDGYWFLVAKKSGKFLGVKDVDSKEDGKELVQWGISPDDLLNRPNEFNNHKFKLMDAGDGYWFLVAKHSGKFLGVNHVDSIKDGEEIVQWGISPGPSDRPNDYDNHKFKLEPVEE